MISTITDNVISVLRVQDEEEVVHGVGRIVDDELSTTPPVDKNLQWPECEADGVRRMVALILLV